MNLQDAIKAVQSLPAIITVTKRNLGPRYLVDVKSQDNSGAVLSVRNNRAFGPMKPVAMMLTVAGGKFSLAVTRSTEAVPLVDDDGVAYGTREKAVIEGMAVAMVLAEHARSTVAKPGPVVVDKTDAFSSVGFCLNEAQHEAERKQRREARQRVMVAQRGGKPQVPAPQVPDLPRAEPKGDKPKKD